MYKLKTIKMKLQLKNIRVSELASEETTYFKADIFKDGKKVGYANNDGHGGCTNYNRYPPYDYAVIREIEEYCKTLPPIVYTKAKDGWDSTIDMTLEHWIDDEIIAYLKKKSDKELAKNMDKGILVAKPNGYEILSFKQGSKSIKISEMLCDERGVSHLIELVNDLKEQGKTILNTNLPEYVLEP